MNWKRKKGKSVLEKANVICRVSDDGTFTIKTPSGHWTEDIAEDSKAAKEKCENYVTAQLLEEDTTRANRQYLERRSKWIAQHKNELETLKHTIITVHTFALLSPPQKTAARQELIDRNLTEVLKLIDNPEILKAVLGEVDKQSFINRCAENYIRSQLCKLENVPFLELIK